MQRRALRDSTVCTMRAAAHTAGDVAEGRQATSELIASSGASTQRSGSILSGSRTASSR